VEDPVGTFATNVMGTAHLLEALRAQSGLQGVLVVTSDKVYANTETGRAFAEGDALGGKDPYSASKAAAEIVTQSFARSYFDAAGVPVATARGGNVIGGGDFSRDRLVADIVRAVKAGQPVALRHPEATRPWQHVLDCVAGYLVYLQALAEDAGAPHAVNFGPEPGGAVITVGELATAALQALGSDKPWVHEPDPTSIEARTLAIDTTLARERLGFVSRLDGPTAVAWTMDWHRAEARGADPRQTCLDQITAYERLT
jgi:CDP-glucose 4,6-dehydratase